MILKPRWYQTEAVEAFFDYFTREKGNPVIAMPTGTGKSLVIAMILQTIFTYYRNQKILCLTHVKELIVQNYMELKNLWPYAPAGIYSAELKRRDTAHPIIFGGIASVVNKAVSFGKVDIVLVDEAHLVSPDEGTMYRKFIAALLEYNPKMKVVGLSATPWRLGQGHIADGTLFNHVCYDITGLESFNRLIAEGYLAPLIPKQTETVLDTDGVSIRNGDFALKELQLAVDRYEITVAALQECADIAADRKSWLIFASGVEHCEHVSEILNGMGIPCVNIHSKLPTGERDRNVASFTSGRVRAAVNNNILTTGFNHRAIDFIGFLRPTLSTVLWVQALGRGTRVSPETGKVNCLVGDFAGNTKQLGPINDPVLPKRKGQGGGEAPVKLCPVCNTYNHASVRQCVNCDEEFKFKVKLQVSAASTELIKGEMPQTEEFEVKFITYSLHQRIGGTPSLKVSYGSNVQMFNEYVCLQHDSNIRNRAQQWWRERAGPGIPMPSTVSDALVYCNYLRTPTHIRVWVNKKPYPEVLAYCWDGSQFGKVIAGDSYEPPIVDVIQPMAKHPVAVNEELEAARRILEQPVPAKSGDGFNAEYDDDIPF
jgi:DNA repair protein RadD